MKPPGPTPPLAPAPGPTVYKRYRLQHHHCGHHRRQHRAAADQFDPAIAEQLWASLPPECRREKFDKKTLPDNIGRSARRAR